LRVLAPPFLPDRTFAAKLRLFFHLPRHIPLLVSACVPDNPFLETGSTLSFRVLFMGEKIMQNVLKIILGLLLFTLLSVAWADDYVCRVTYIPSTPTVGNYGVI
jgi:hypothetical protein